MEQLIISESIMACQLAFSGKKLLAHICRRAAVNAGQCIDTNRELGRAMAIHPHTVSSLIGRLVKEGLLSTTVYKKQANCRSLVPRPDLLEDGLSITNRADERTTPCSSITTSEEAITFSKRVTLPSDTKQVGDEAIAFLASLFITPTFVHSSPEGGLIIECDAHDHYYLIEFYPDGGIVLIAQSEADTQAWDITADTGAVINAMVPASNRVRIIKTWLTRCRRIMASQVRQTIHSAQPQAIV